MTKPGLPQGTRDFGPETVRKRHFIFDTIRTVFETYGYEPIETPAMENMETLLGKYGEEGDKLIFKILNNGLDLPAKKESSREAFENILGGKNDPAITERALRYDLTIPFARYVATHHQQLAMPFRRYQIQPVWRADRPQKGRYREFYQCDADVVGSRSLINEVELATIYLKVFQKLRVPVELRINHRKILSGLAELCGGASRVNVVTTAIDKLDKIGLEKVKEELLAKDLTAVQIGVVEKYLQLKGDAREKILQLTTLIPGHFTEAAAADLQFVLKHFSPQELSPSSQEQPTGSVVLDLSLARGLNYYTGIIFEVKAQGVALGSIGGGGRYDDLTGLFGVAGIPGVGISFGVDRIYDVMEELRLFPETLGRSTELLFFNLGPGAAEKSFELMEDLRDRGIRCELFHEAAKFDKQFKYAEKKHIPSVVIIGEDELKSATAKVKNLGSGLQESIPFADLGAYFKNQTGPPGGF
jgi:histidyl-tRNA synthetase